MVSSRLWFSLTLFFLWEWGICVGGGTTDHQLSLLIPRAEEHLHAVTVPSSFVRTTTIVGTTATSGTTTGTKQRISLRKTLARAGKKAFRGGMSGFIAGAIQVLTLMWLRTANNYQYRYGVSMTTALHDLYQQGGLSRFYRGWPYALVQGPLARFGAVAANDASIVFAAYWLGQSERASKGAFSTALGSILAGLWRLFLMPVDTCKTVLQVDGVRGFQLLWEKVKNGDCLVLYSGAFATILATVVGHYPWFLVHNFLDGLLAVPSSTPGLLCRSAFIGFCASALSDTISNSIRVVKTVKQAAAGEINVGGKSLSYEFVIRKVLSEGGLRSLFGRGLMTRILANGIQSMLFTVIWKWLSIVSIQQKNKLSLLRSDDITTTTIPSQSSSAWGSTNSGGGASGTVGGGNGGGSDGTTNLRGSEQASQTSKTN